MTRQLITVFTIISVSQVRLKKKITYVLRWIKYYNYTYLTHIVSYSIDYWKMWSGYCNGSVDCIQVVMGVVSFYNFSLVITWLLTQDYATVPWVCIIYMNRNARIWQISLQLSTPITSRILSTESLHFFFHICQWSIKLETISVKYA